MQEKYLATGKDHHWANEWWKVTRDTRLQQLRHVETEYERYDKDTFNQGMRDEFIERMD